MGAAFNAAYEEFKALYKQNKSLALLAIILCCIGLIYMFFKTLSDAIVEPVLSKINSIYQTTRLQFRKIKLC